jgi:hypothetical protein
VKNDVQLFAKAVRDNPPMIGRDETLAEEFARRRLSEDDFVARYRPMGVTEDEFRAELRKRISK